MAETSRRISRWLCMAVLLPTALADPGETRAEDPPKGQLKPMFRAPDGWKMTRRSDDLLFFDAPVPKGQETRRIAVIAPMEEKLSFSEWFQLVQAPAPVVSESKVTKGKSNGGYETLRQIRVVEKSGGKLHRHYCGLHVGTNNVLILFSSSHESLFDTNLKEVQKLVDSWDASGVFPAANKQEEK
jgi:hypothetical protein